MLAAPRGRANRLGSGRVDRYFRNTEVSDSDHVEGGGDEWNGRPIGWLRFAVVATGVGAVLDNASPWRPTALPWRPSGGDQGRPKDVPCQVCLDASERGRNRFAAPKLGRLFLRLPVAWCLADTFLVFFDLASKQVVRKLLFLLTLVSSWMLRSETEEFGPVGYGKMSCFPMAKNRLFLALVSVPETNWFRWYQRVKVNDRKSAKLKWWRSRTMHECESSMASVHLGSTQFESRA